MSSPPRAPWLIWRTSRAFTAVVRWFVVGIGVAVVSILAGDAPYPSSSWLGRNPLVRVVVIRPLSSGTSSDRRPPRSVGQRLAYIAYAGAVPGTLSIDEGERTVLWCPPEPGYMGLWEFAFAVPEAHRVRSKLFFFRRRRLVHVEMNDANDLWLYGHAKNRLLEKLLRNAGAS